VAGVGFLLTGSNDGLARSAAIQTRAFLTADDPDLTVRADANTDGLRTLNHCPAGATAVKLKNRSVY